MSEELKARAPMLAPNSQDLLIYGLYLAGGSDNWVDVETLFLTMFEIAPGRFSWRTRSDLPDYKKLSKALQSVEDQRRSKHQALISQNGEYFRKLSEQGAEWCLRYESCLRELYGGQVVPASARQESFRLLRYVQTTDAFRAFRESGHVESPTWELAEAFQCLVDSRDEVWRQRFDALAWAGQINGDVLIIEFVSKSRARWISNQGREIGSI